MLRSSAFLYWAHAGSFEVSRWSPHPDIAPAGYRRDRPDGWTLPRRRSADRPGLFPRHGDLSTQVYDELLDESVQPSADCVRSADRRMVGPHRPARDRRRFRFYLRDQPTELPVGRSG